MMKNSDLEAVVIGAGHAGLSISYYLKQLGKKHIVLEQNTIGNSWSSQRWDSFKLNTPNKFSLLPGMNTNSTDPDGFCSAKEFVDSLKSYAKMFELPVIEDSKVISVEKLPNAGIFSITTKHKADIINYECRKLVVASGMQNIKWIPEFSSNISKEIFQLHAGDYRNSNTLPKGNVLVIGSGQSGVQIAEDLIDSGRKVYLATSMVARVPRRYRGKDIFEWLDFVGFNDHRTIEFLDPHMLKMEQPQLSGIGKRGKTVSLQALAKKGVIILGKIDDAKQNHIYIQANAVDHVKFADEFSHQIKAIIDEFIENAKVDAPLPEIDPADLPDGKAECVSNEKFINLSEHNITTIIWATGFRGNFDYLKLPVFSDEGNLEYNDGIAAIEGLYFLGFPWLRKRKSGIVHGINEDAKFISEKINGTL